MPEIQVPLKVSVEIGEAAIASVKVVDEVAAVKSVAPATHENDTLVSFGGEVKALGDGKVGGFLVVFSGMGDPDLAGDFFTKDTDFGPHRTSLVWYDHALDGEVGKRVIGSGSIEVRDAGVWIEAQLERRDDYEKWIDDMVGKGKLGWSSGTASHLVEREQMGKSAWIKSWPLGLDASLTPTPCEPRTLAIPLKSYAVLKARGASWMDTIEALRSAVQESHGSETEWCWVCDVYEKSVVWSGSGRNGTYYEASYTVDDAGKVSLGKPREVIRTVSYKPAKAIRPETAREQETYLREVMGYSQNEAKMIVAKGFSALRQREVDSASGDTLRLKAKREALLLDAEALSLLHGGLSNEERASREAC